MTREGAERATLSTFADPERAEHAALRARAEERGLPLKLSEKDRTATAHRPASSPRTRPAAD